MAKKICKNIYDRWRKAEKGIVFTLLIGVLLGNAIGNVIASEGINVDYHSQEEIKAYADTYGFYGEATYTQQPVRMAPYSPGQLSNETQQGALETLNFMRYIAGIPYNVQLDSEYINMAQAGCLVNAVNGSMSHYPDKPYDMQDDLFQLGYNGANKSNLSWGYNSLVDAILNGWMNDGDSSNIDRIGHRRWILNPSMKKTGFGCVGSFCALYATDSPFDETNQYGIAWPAQTMPTELFTTSYPWNISMGYEVDYGSVNVKLTNETTGYTWNFSSQYADGDFYVDNQGYGQKGCIIFRPNAIDEYRSGDRFLVEITGLKEKVSYEVRFFDLYPELHVVEDEIYFDDSFWEDYLYEGEYIGYEEDPEAVEEIRETQESELIITQETTEEEITQQETPQEETTQKKTTEEETTQQETAQETVKEEESSVSQKTESATDEKTGTEEKHKVLWYIAAIMVVALMAGVCIVWVRRRKRS